MYPFCKYRKCFSLWYRGRNSGITDETNRTVLGGAENIVGWENVPLADILEKETGLPVSVANDANMMGLREQAFGAAKGCSDVLFITVGTGIGGAVIIDNKLYGGYKNRGTESDIFLSLPTENPVPAEA